MNDRAENPGMLVSTDEMCYTPNGELAVKISVRPQAGSRGNENMDKIRTTVKIAGKEYTIAGYDSKEHVRRVAAIVDRKMNELSIQTRLPAAQLAVLVAMNMADEMVKSQNEIQKLRRELDTARLALEQLKNENAGD